MNKRVLTGENASVNSPNNSPEKAVDNFLYTCTDIEFLDFLFAWIAIDLQRKETVAQIRIRNQEIINNPFSAFTTNVLKLLFQKKFTLHGDVCFKERKSVTKELEGICIAQVSGFFAVIMSHTPFLHVCEIAVFQRALKSNAYM